MYGSTLGPPGGPSRPYPQEVRLNAIFDELSQGFKKLDKLPETKQQKILRDMTVQMQEAKQLIRDFERDARADDMPTEELNYRKKQLVQELNSFIGLKKAYGAQSAQRSELLGTSSSKEPVQEDFNAMQSADLMEMGRKQIQDTDQALVRSERIVNDTIAIGGQTAETLQIQGKQLETVSRDLDEIHFSMRNASNIIRDMARGLATDKCILGLLLLVVIGVVVVVALKVAHVGGA